MIDLFEKILSKYSEAYKYKSADSVLISTLKDELPFEIRKIIVEKERYKVKGSIGAGNLPAIPWVAIFDILVTETATAGYYPVFLFRDDMSGFYLSLNQGVTKILETEKFQKDAIGILKLMGDNFRAQISVIPSGFTSEDIKLKLLKVTTPKYAKSYEAGNIISKFYSADNLPSEKEIKTDITEILKVYELISYNEGLPTIEGQREEDDDNYYKEIEDLRRFRFHKRIERNNNLSKKVKKVQGYICKSCDFDFEKGYGAKGKDFIEAHHLNPISTLGKVKIELDARKDFTVLCSNCHSMIHKQTDPSDLETLKSERFFKVLFQRNK